VVKKVTIAALFKVENILKKIRLRLKPIDKSSPKFIQAKRVEPWFAANGDKTLRLSYNLNEGSVVYDFGGYEGQWASDIYGRYNCQVHVFEPYKPFFDNIVSRFERNNKIKVYPFGLGSSVADVPFSNLDDASSALNTSVQATDTIRIESVSEFFASNNVGFIDLMKINIEGGEYDLLETLLDLGYIKSIDNIQVQFHDFLFDNARQRMESIQKRLSETHELTYQFDFVWENWKLKK
jgi:FkbM family methyltransferase